MKINIEHAVYTVLTILILIIFVFSAVVVLERKNASSRDDTREENFEMGLGDTREKNSDGGRESPCGNDEAGETSRSLTSKIMEPANGSNPYLEKRGARSVTGMLNYVDIGDDTNSI